MPIPSKANSKHQMHPNKSNYCGVSGVPNDLKDKGTFKETGATGAVNAGSETADGPLEAKVGNENGGNGRAEKGNGNGGKAPSFEKKE